MKKAVAKFITSLGGSSKYSGKDYTMYVEAKKYSNSFTLPQVADPEKKVEIMKAVKDKFAKPDMPFKLA